MNKALTSARTAARTRFKKQSPRIWFVIVGRKSQAMVINSEAKTKIAEGPICDGPENALEALTRNIRPVPIKAGS